MKSICSTFAAKACFSLLIFSFALASSFGQDNYSLWPKRPDTFAEVRKLVADGKIDESIQKLAPLINQRSSVRGQEEQDRIIRQEAKAMLGDLRIKQILSPSSKDLQTYTVRRGDSWLGIARKTKCPLDYIIHVNQLMELEGLHAGQKIKIKELNYRVEVNTLDKEVSIWDGESFIKSYPIVMMKDEGKSNFSTSIRSESALFNGNPVTIYSPDFAAADKSLQLAHGGLMIDSSPDGKMRKPGFYLKREDCNELSLMLRASNTVDIIREAK